MKGDKHNILYLMRSVHMDGRIFVNDKKIGVTGKGNATLKSRIAQLSSTKNIFGAQCIAAWEVDIRDENSALYYERELHHIFKNQMVPDVSNGKTEWFYDDDHSSQLGIIETIFLYAKNNNLILIEMDELQDSNAKILANRMIKANYDDIISSVKNFLDIPNLIDVKTRDCTRFTTPDNRSFHVNIRADITKQYISISKTKQDYERYQLLCNENDFNYQISKLSGNIRVYVKTPREIAKVIDTFYRNEINHDTVEY
jgi:hypothetical protein